MKKARNWLTEHEIDHEFHDHRKDGLDGKQLIAWEKEIGWETLLNRRGQIWRKLPEDIRESINREVALDLMQENPGIIKRPLLDVGKQRIIGFKAEQYKALFSN